MAICLHCEQDMLKADGCVMIPIPINGEPVKPIRYGDEREGWGDYGLEPQDRCHDCNCKLGQYHHPGCDIERCPVCGGQLISCGCIDEEQEVSG